MIAAWFAARLAPIGAGVAILLALFAWDKVRISNAETRGANKSAAKYEAKNNAAVSLSNSAGAASRNSAVGGVRDPYTRAD